LIAVIGAGAVCAAAEIANAVTSKDRHKASMMKRILLSFVIRV